MRSFQIKSTELHIFRRTFTGLQTFTFTDSYQLIAGRSYSGACLQKRFFPSNSRIAGRLP